MAPRDVRVLQHDVRTRGCGRSRRGSPLSTLRRPLAHEQRLAAVVDRLEPARVAVGRVDHRVAEVARPTARAACGPAPLLLGRREQLGLDPELAEVEALVGVELHLRPASTARTAPGARARAGSRTAPCAAPARSSRTARGPAARGRRGSGSARTRARRRPSGCPPSPWRACGPARPAGRSCLKARPKAPSTRPAELRLEVAQHAHLVPQGSPKPWSHAAAVRQRLPVRRSCGRDDTHQRAAAMQPATAPRAWSSARSRGERVAERGMGRDQRRGAERRRPARSTASQRPRTTSASTTAHRRPGQRRARAPGDVSERLQRVGRGRARSSPPSRRAAAPPSGAPNRSALPGEHLADARATTRPAAARPARRAGVGASAATPMKAGAERDRAEQRRQHGHRPEQAGARKQERDRARRRRRARAPCPAGRPPARRASRTAPITREQPADARQHGRRDRGEPGRGEGREGAGPGRASSRHAEHEAAGGQSRRRRARGRAAGAARGRRAATRPGAASRRLGEIDSASSGSSPVARVVGEARRGASVAGSTRPPSSVSSRSAACSSARSFAGRGPQRPGRRRARRRSRRRARSGRSRRMRAQRGQRPAEAARGGGGARRRGPGWCPSTPRTGSARASRRRTPASRARPRPARAPCRRACRRCRRCA